MTCTLQRIFFLSRFMPVGFNNKDEVVPTCVSDGTLPPDSEVQIKIYVEVLYQAPGFCKYSYHCVCDVLG